MLGTHLKFTIPAELASVETSVAKIRSNLEDLKIKNDNLMGAIFHLEDVLHLMISHAPKDKAVKVNIKLDSFLGNTILRINCRGTAFTLDDMQTESVAGEDEVEGDEQLALRKQMGKFMATNIKLRNVLGLNLCLLRVQRSEQFQTMVTLLCMLAGIAFGIGGQFCLAPEINQWLTSNLFDPIMTMFLNGIKAFVGPLIFFSISASLVNLTDLKNVGRMATRILGTYVFTSLVAIGIGFLIYFLLPTGDPSMLSLVSGAPVAGASVTETTISFKSLLVSIVPNSVVTPFIKLETLQIIFLAVITGVAAGTLGEMDAGLGQLLDTCNNLVGKIIGMFALLLPLISFVSMAQVCLNIDLANVLYLFGWVGDIALGLGLQLAFYCLCLGGFVGLNPLTFFKNLVPAITTALATSSSNATLPVSSAVCRDKFHISSHVYSFSLPLGATVNMDGCCIAYTIIALTGLRIYSIPISSENIASIIITVMAISVGSPGIPGAVAAMIAFVLQGVGVPVEALALFIPMATIVDVMSTSVNVAGDISVTASVAKTLK